MSNCEHPEVIPVAAVQGKTVWIADKRCFVSGTLVQYFCANPRCGVIVRKEESWGEPRCEE